MLDHMIWVLVVLGLSLHVEGHGRLLKPPGRGTAWRDPRYSSIAPHDYNDNQLYCGGKNTQWSTNGGECGVCGDNWGDPEPRAHEDGGLYARNVLIVDEYTSGQRFDVTVQMTANHLGWFEFRLCVRDDRSTKLTHECLNRHLLSDGNGKTRFEIGSSLGNVVTNLQLPAGVTCEQCVLQWKYSAGNDWGICTDGTGRRGCSSTPEQFYGCADIRISGSNGNGQGSSGNGNGGGSNGNGNGGGSNDNGQGSSGNGNGGGSNGNGNGGGSNGRGSNGNGNSGGSNGNGNGGGSSGNGQGSSGNGNNGGTNENGRGTNNNGNNGRSNDNGNAGDSNGNGQGSSGNGNNGASNDNGNAGDSNGNGQGSSGNGNNGGSNGNGRGTNNNGNNGGSNGNGGGSVGNNGRSLICTGAGLWRGSRGMTRWCTVNCNHPVPNCPRSHCTCRRESEPDEGAPGGAQTPNCTPAGIWASVPAMGDWCTTNCALGNCPASHCTCRNTNLP